MKLVFSIIHNEDSTKVIKELNKGGFGVTKLATTGGFLSAGNTTLIIGTNAENIQTVVEIIKKYCSSRKQLTAAPTPTFGIENDFSYYPLEVDVGGATIFVVDVERFEKL